MSRCTKVPGVRVALAAGSPRLAGARYVAMQPTRELSQFRGAQVHQTRDKRNGTNTEEIHPMISAELSRVGCSGTDRANRSRPLAHKTTTVAAFAAVLSIDLLTKAWAAVAFAEPVRIADWLYLMLHHNAGMFLGAVPVSAGYWVCVFAVLGWFGWRALRSYSTPVAVCVAAALAGLTGNAIGQAQGAVVDFIGVGPVTGNLWLVANIADLALVVGVLGVGFFRIRERARRAHRPG